MAANCDTERRPRPAPANSGGVRRQRSATGIEEAPEHGSDAVERLQRIIGPGTIDRPGRDEQPQMAVDLLGRPVGDSPEMCAVATLSTVAFGEIRRHRAGRTSELVCDRLEWDRYLQRKAVSDASGFPSLTHEPEVIVAPPLIAAAALYSSHP